MRLPEMTICQMMVGVAALAIWLAIVRWGVVIYVLCSAALTYVPAFLWTATGGKIGGRGEPRDTSEVHGDLFLWAWALGTIGLASISFIADILIR